jgi:hypothetical protein
MTYSPGMTNPPDPGKQTQIIDVKGRNVVIRELNDAQLVLMAREARLATKDDIDIHRRMAAVGRIFDILESCVVQEEDRDYLMDLTVKGSLELKDMMDFIAAFAPEEVAKPRVRRGRPAKRIS